ncbi:MAG: Hsp70 family protein, partial [Myxococcota bacterium]|nr:Hsp70 family protein [Myxococcota bacterium]
KEDVIGTMLDSYTWPDHLTEGSPIRMTLSADDLEAGSIVPVRLEVHVTEIGTVEIWAVNPTSEKRWRLEFSVRETGEE